MINWLSSFGWCWSLLFSTKVWHLCKCGWRSGLSHRLLLIEITSQALWIMRSGCSITILLNSNSSKWVTSSYIIETSLRWLIGWSTYWSSNSKVWQGRVRLEILLVNLILALEKTDLIECILSNLSLCWLWSHWLARS